MSWYALTGCSKPATGEGPEGSGEWCLTLRPYPSRMLTWYGRGLSGDGGSNDLFSRAPGVSEWLGNGRFRPGEMLAECGDFAPYVLNYGLGYFRYQEVGRRGL